MTGFTFITAAIRRPSRGRVLRILAVAACFCCLPARAEVITDLYSTGLANDGNLIGNGATDPHWALMSSPTVGGTANYYNGAAKAYYIDQWSPANQTSAPKSQWITVPNGLEAVTFTPSGQYCSAAVYEFAPGYYEYQTSFTLPAGFTEASIAGKWVCDNYSRPSLDGGGMLLNGVSKPLGTVVDGFQLFSVTDGFQEGTNTLSFFVKNVRDTTEDYNPTGLQVEVSGTYAVPEPGTAILAVIGVGMAGWACRRGARRR